MKKWIQKRLSCRDMPQLVMNGIHFLPKFCTCCQRPFFILLHKLIYFSGTIENIVYSHLVRGYCLTGCEMIHFSGRFG